MLNNRNPSSIPAFLQKSRNRKIVIAGIGNILRRDDGVGVHISSNIQQTKQITVINAEVSIENYIGKINQIKPDILLLIDCMHLNMAPGGYKFVSMDDITDHTFTTHNISLNRLNCFFSMETYVLGIQPGDISFGEVLTDEVRDSARQIIREFNQFGNTSNF